MSHEIIPLYVCHSAWHINAQQILATVIMFLHGGASQMIFFDSELIFTHEIFCKKSAGLACCEGGLEITGWACVPCCFQGECRTGRVDKPSSHSWSLGCGCYLTLPWLCQPMGPWPVFHSLTQLIPGDSHCCRGHLVRWGGVEGDIQGQFI